MTIQEVARQAAENVRGIMPVALAHEVADAVCAATLREVRAVFVQRDALQLERYQHATNSFEEGAKYRTYEAVQELDKLLASLASSPEETPEKPWIPTADCICDRCRNAVEPPVPLVPTPPETQRALDNVYMLARREVRRIERRLDVAPVLAPTLERWQHVLRICEEAGGGSAGILRRSLPTELTEGESSPAPGAVKTPEQERYFK